MYPLRFRLVAQAVVIPRIIAQQLAALAVLRTTLMVVSSMQHGWTALLSQCTAKGRRRKVLRSNMRAATSYDEWRKCAHDIDKVQGHL